MSLLLAKSVRFYLNFVMLCYVTKQSLSTHSRDRLKFCFQEGNQEFLHLKRLPSESDNCRGHHFELKLAKVFVWEKEGRGLLLLRGKGLHISDPNCHSYSVMIIDKRAKVSFCLN